MIDAACAAAGEIERLRLEQVRCAQAAREAKTDAERFDQTSTGSSGDLAIRAAIQRDFDYAMLGVNDYLVEELLLTFWMELLSGQARLANPGLPGDPGVLREP